MCKTILLYRLKSYDKEVYVVIRDKDVIVFIAIKKDILFANYIRRLVVRKDMHSKGIGTKLVKFIEELTYKSRLPNFS
ncbi:MAG: GNAT family N-acetyltransferase [Asgard group archaeon]|nr:GNAT family N-acetyltransferase [Asgard group archaeon]